MAQVLIRNLDDEVIVKLKRIAARESKSLEQKFRDMAEREARREDDDFWELARLSREMTREAKVDVDAAIHQGREERDRAVLGDL
jgi:plasmid stability protein